MPSDLEISHSIKPRQISEIASKFGLSADETESYGHYKAKIALSAMQQPPKANSHLVVVTALTPTALGEGKTVTTIGLSLGLNKIGLSSCACIRQPSMGPVFGIKGGAAGGGYSQVIPMEDFNLHLTGDIHALTACHNLAAAALDSRLFHETKLGKDKFTSQTSLPYLDIDPDNIVWKRVVDLNDRALRQIQIGLPTPGADKNDNGIPRSSGFDITVASELMAILALTTSMQDLRQRIGKVILAYNQAGQPITCEDLQVAGAMTALLRDAIKPTLMQTLEATPCLVHAGPFANIAHGNSSIIADIIAMGRSNFVVTEAGFGSDMGFEKFCNIKCRVSGMTPSCAVIVATLRAVKLHSGQFKVTLGKPLPSGLVEENAVALAAGLPNLAQHIAIVKAHGIPAVVAINRFPHDTDQELQELIQQSIDLGADAAVVNDCHRRGGAGATDLARQVEAICSRPTPVLKHPYALSDSISDKIRAIATKIYGAVNVNFSDQAQQQIAAMSGTDYEKFPVCMAKTHLSFSHDAKLLGAPTDFVLPVREVKVSAGAGFVYALTESIRTMPGLGSKPSYIHIDIDADGNIQGLF